MGDDGCNGPSPGCTLTPIEGRQYATVVAKLTADIQRTWRVRRAYGGAPCRPV